nr:hypothetical protein [Tanacetum cinerariifolium]
MQEKQKMEAEKWKTRKPKDSKTAVKNSPIGPRGAGFCWGMVVEVRGSSGEWWKLSRNVGKGVAGHGGKYG